MTAVVMFVCCLLVSSWAKPLPEKMYSQQEILDLIQKTLKQESSPVDQLEVSLKEIDAAADVAATLAINVLEGTLGTTTAPATAGASEDSVTVTSVAAPLPTQDDTTDYQQVDSKEMLNIIEKTLLAASTTTGRTTLPPFSQNEVDPIEENGTNPIDELLQRYIDEAGPNDRPDSGLSLLLQYYAITGQYHDIMIHAFVTSKNLNTFASQLYSSSPTFRIALVKRFMSAEGYQRSVLRKMGTQCSQVRDMLESFVSSFSSAEYSVDEKQVLENWSEKECFKGALLQTFLASSSFKIRAEHFLTSSELSAKAILKEFLSSGDFVDGLIVEYIKTKSLYDFFSLQFSESPKFQDLLLKKFVDNTAFRESVLKDIPSVDHSSPEYPKM